MNRGEFFGSGRRRGRPRGRRYTVPLSLRLPSDIYDAACKIATLNRTDLPKLVRQAITDHVARNAPST